MRGFPCLLFALGLLVGTAGAEEMSYVIKVDFPVKSPPKRVPKIDKVLYLWGDRSGRPFSSYMDRG